MTKILSNQSQFASNKFLTESGIFFQSISQRYFSLKEKPNWIRLSSLPGNQGIAEPWNAAILIAGHQIKIQIQLYFSLRSAKNSLGRLLNESVSQIHKNTAIDFVEEWANQLGGGLKNILMEQGMDLGHSLPISYPSYCNALQSFIQDEIIYWKLEISEIEFYYIKLSVLGDLTLLQNIQVLSHSSNLDEDEVEFL